MDRDYYLCWQGLRSHFDPAFRDGGADGCLGSSSSQAAGEPPLERVESMACHRVDSMDAWH